MTELIFCRRSHDLGPHYMAKKMLLQTRVWEQAPKPESVDASFLLFCHIVRSQVMRSNHKKSILSCCPNEVFGEVRSTSVSFAINLCAQSMSYQNQHSLSQPYWNLLFFLLFFPSRFVSLLLVFSFNCLGSLLFLTSGFVSLGKYAAVCFLLLCEHITFHLPYQRETNKPFSEV